MAVVQKTLHGCLAFMTSPPTLIKMQAKASYQIFMRNGFRDWMARYIEKTILVFILYNLASYAHSQPMKRVILPTLFYPYQGNAHPTLIIGHF